MVTLKRVSSGESGFVIFRQKGVDGVCEMHVVGYVVEPVCKQKRGFAERCVAVHIVLCVYVFSL